MQLDAVQDRIIKAKPKGISLLKGASGTGKTTAAVYRAVYLKNNYCLYDEDRILILAKDSSSRDLMRSMYNKIEDETRIDYRTLFTNNVDRVDILTIEDMINRVYFEYTNNYKKWFKIIHEDSEKLSILDDIVKKFGKNFGYSNLLNKNHLSFFKDEISWMKACGYGEMESYQNADRIGRRYKKGEGPSRLLKNSKEREVLYNLFCGYNDKLQENSLIDSDDISRIALTYIKGNSVQRYTHILIDDAEKLTKTQIDFIRELISEKDYWSLMFIINKSDSTNFKSWFAKGRKQSNLDLGSVKGYILSKAYETVQKEEVLMKSSSFNSSMEFFEYLDLKHHRRYEFKRDYDIQAELILKDGEKENVVNKEELRGVQVYSDIAAGEPILMNSDIEEEFYLPEYWLKGSSECFMLRVKGDSMIGANIFDEDFVVIRRQNTAQKGDIVAVDLDGSATLKRLHYDKGVALLMPENDKYDPIFMHDREASILGIAVGVVKKKM